MQKSYGIRIADHAWLPRSVVESAYEYLKQYSSADSASAPVQHQLLWVQEDVEVNKYSELLETVDVNETTPLDALRILHELVQIQRKG